MADLTLTPKDYNYLLAMINHEAGNTISNSLKKGDTNDAFGQIVGLAETWMNRAAAKGSSMEGVMYHPQLSHFPTQSAPDYSLIQSKANSLDPRIKEIFDGYLYNRSQGENGLLGKVNQYLNRDVTDALYSQKYRDWYDKSDLVGAYGDKRNGGTSSLQQEFLHNSQMTIPDYNLKVSPEIRLSPSEAAVENFAAFQNAYQPPPRTVANAPLPPPRPEEFRGDGFVGPVNEFSDAITAGLEGAGNAAIGGLNAIGDTISGLFSPTPAAAQGAGPAPGPYDFAQFGSPGGIGDPNFGAGITPSAPAGPAPGPYDFAGGLAAGGNTPDGSFGAGITPGSPPPAPDAYDFAGGLAAGGNVPNGDFGAGITQPGAQVAGTIGPTEASTLAPQQAAAVPYNGFNAQAYLAANQDVANSASYGNNPLQHYLDYGYAEGRTLDPEGHQIARGIDLNQYLAKNVDVAQAGQNPLEHYLRYGAAEGRALAPGSTGTIIGAPGATGSLPPTMSGLAPPPGLSPTIGPTAGQSVTASPGIGNYDFASNYLTANPDVAAAGMNPWEHFVRFGAKEGRALDTAGDKFDANAYLSQNVDVQQAGQDALTHYLTYGASEGRAAPIIGADGTARNISSLGVTPTISAMLTPYLQPQGTAPTIGAPGLSPLIGPETAPTIGPDFASLIGAGPSVQATSPGVVSPFGFGGNVSQGVAPGSFGAGITPQAPIGNWGFSGANVGGGLGATAQGLGGDYAVGSAVSNMGMDLPGATGVIDYGFGGDVSGFDVNQGGGAPAAQEAPVALGYGDGGAIQGRNSQLSQNEYFATQARQQALATANANLFGQQITGIAPGNQTVYDYATGKATGGPAPQIQQTAFTPVNMGGVFAPLATAAFMPRFSF